MNGAPDKSEDVVDLTKLLVRDTCSTSVARELVGINGAGHVDKYDNLSIPRLLRATEKGKLDDVRLTVWEDGDPCSCCGKELGQTSEPDQVSRLCFA